MSEHSEHSEHSDQLYRKMVLQKQLSIRPDEINKNINKNLEKCLKSSVEGICIKEGYVRFDSTKILSRTFGKLDIVNFSGNTTYNVMYQVEICNPQKGQIIECEVEDNNKSAVNAFVGDVETSPLDIYLPRSHYNGNAEFISLKKGDIIKVKVIKHKFEYKDTVIAVVAEYLEKL
jgi:DNA-directed RNA polymerase subunit E'/Rpb7